MFSRNPRALARSGVPGSVAKSSLWASSISPINCPSVICARIAVEINMVSLLFLFKAAPIAAFRGRPISSTARSVHRNDGNKVDDRHGKKFFGSSTGARNGKARGKNYMPSGCRFSRTARQGSNEERPPWANGQDMKETGYAGRNRFWRGFWTMVKGLKAGPMGGRATDRYTNAGTRLPCSAPQTQGFSYVSRETAQPCFKEMLYWKAEFLSYRRFAVFLEEIIQGFAHQILKAGFFI